MKKRVITLRLHFLYRQPRLRRINKATVVRLGPLFIVFLRPHPELAGY
jgi:hypothetical protein